MPIRVTPVHRGGSPKVHHYTATWWNRDVPKMSRQGATREKAIKALQNAMGTDKLHPRGNPRIRS